MQSDATVDAQKLLSCIYRLKQRFGLMHTIEVLRGSQTEKIKQFGHDSLSTFGIGKDKSANYWKQLAWQLIHKDYCRQDAARFNVLVLTPKAIPLLRGEESIALTIPHNDLTTKAKKKRVKQPGNPLFELLRGVRRALADEENKPPFMIFSDATLHAFVQARPQSSAALLQISGVGQHKRAQYGEALLRVLRENEGG
jgi:ATP-dependent DNA helicase RecQ